MCLLSWKVSQNQSLRICGEVFGSEVFVSSRTRVIGTGEGSRISKGGVSRTVPRGEHWLSSANPTSELSSYRNCRCWLLGVRLSGAHVHENGKGTWGVSDSLEMACTSKCVFLHVWTAYVTPRKLPVWKTLYVPDVWKETKYACFL